MPACDSITPATQILDAEGRDWAWAYAVFRPFHRGYSLSSDGSVWSALNNHGAIVPGRWKRLTGGVDRYGYNYFNFCVEGRVRTLRSHRIIAEAFLGNPSPGMQACHNNGNSLDNRVYNLRWDSVSANHIDKRAHGTSRCGSAHPRLHLSEDDVIEIRARVRRGEYQRDVAKSFGIAESAVGSIVRGETWRHVAM